MIIRMRRDAGKISAMRVARHFIALGLNVFVENGNGRISLAVFKLENDDDYFSTEGIIGIDGVRQGNKYFCTNRTKFISAEIYFENLISAPI